MCVCVRESETESGSERGSESVRESEREWERVRERERGREKEMEREMGERERDRQRHRQRPANEGEREGVGKEAARDGWIINVRRHAAVRWFDKTSMHSCLHTWLLCIHANIHNKLCRCISEVCLCM